MSTNSIYFGTKQPSEIYYGGKKVSEVWKGSHQLYPNKIDITNVLYWQGTDNIVINDTTIQNEETVNKDNEQWYSAKCGPFTNDKYEFTMDKNTSLTKIDISHIDTTLLTTASNMFNRCENVTEINLGDFDFSKISNISGLFSWCIKLNTLKVGSYFKAPTNVNKLAGVFSNCRNITDDIINIMDVFNWNTTGITTTIQCFYNTINISKLDLHKWDFSNVTNMDYMFYDVFRIKYLDLHGCDFSKVTSSKYTFRNTGNYVDCIANFLNTKNINGFGIGTGNKDYNFANTSFTTLTGNNIPTNEDKIFEGMDTDFYFPGLTLIDEDQRIYTIKTWFNGLTDNSNSNSKTIYFNGNIEIYNDIFTDEIKKIATNKNWVLSDDYPY